MITMKNESSKEIADNIPYSFLYEQHLIEKALEQALKIKPTIAEMDELMPKKHTITPHTRPYKTILDILREKKRI
jgi:hypothetical protein